MLVEVKYSINDYPETWRSIVQNQTIVIEATGPGAAEKILKAQYGPGLVIHGAHQKR